MHAPPIALPFKKSRAKKIYEVLCTMCPVEEGNQKIEISDKGTFIFSYRGTPIVEYDFKNRRWNKIDAGKYEDTPSTQSQRKAIYEAIEEFEALL